MRPLTQAVYPNRAMGSGTPSRSTIRVDPGQAALIAVLLFLAAVGWLVTDRRMAGMDHGPGTELGSLGFYVGAWVVMMAAMMFPSIAPMVGMYRRVQRRRTERGRAVPGATALFVAGYIGCWSAFGLVAYALFALGASLELELLGWHGWGRYVAGAVIVGAALYQLTPLKDACLSRCRSPLAFVMMNWRNGRAGATVMGLEHGAWCVGCCWALMASLFALGVMSVGWMVFVAALIAVEKLLPWKTIANRGIAVLLLSLGFAVALVPERVPGLTIPHEVHGGDRGEMDRMMSP
jgi:predicted metal-binding membrane protein